MVKRRNIALYKPAVRACEILEALQFELIAASLPLHLVVESRLSVRP
jgi:hypothetical protein